MVKTPVLRLAVMFWFLLYLSRSVGGASAQQNDMLPQNVKDEILSSYYGAESHRNIQFEVTGKGTILPYEHTNGVEVVICLKIRYEKQLSPDNWVSGTQSRIILRTGNEWSVKSGLQWVERPGFNILAPDYMSCTSLDS